MYRRYLSKAWRHKTPANKRQVELWRHNCIDHLVYHISIYVSTSKKEQHFCLILQLQSLYIHKRPATQYTLRVLHLVLSLLQTAIKWFSGLSLYVNFSQLYTLLLIRHWAWDTQICEIWKPLSEWTLFAPKACTVTCRICHEIEKPTLCACMCVSSSSVCLENMTPHYSSDITLAQPLASGIASSLLHTHRWALQVSSNSPHVLGQQQWVVGNLRMLSGYSDLSKSAYSCL